jgi:ubiquinone/menaquinone biosynthesis C-methylase UbiE
VTADRWKRYWDQHAQQVGSDDPLRQVLRVVNRQPIGEQAFKLVADNVIQLLEIDPSHVVLDLCCGNGLLSAAIEPYASQIVAADFCERLLEDVRSRTTAKTTTMIADARMVDFPPASFDRVLIAAALQHFEQDEVIRMFRQMVRALRPRGILVATDIPDAARKWAFHDSVEREDDYFRNEAEGTPILGTWFDRTWLEKLGRHVGFKETTALDQPVTFPYAHYRFDLRCRL